MDIKNIMTWRNIYTNVISINPLEDNPEKVEAMKLKQLADIMGFKFYYLRKNKFKNLLRGYYINNEPVFTFMDSGNLKVIVNPCIHKPLNVGSERILKILFK